MVRGALIHFTWPQPPPFVLPWYTYTRHMFNWYESYQTHHCNISENIKSNKYRDKTTMSIRQQEIAEMLKQRKTNSRIPVGRPEPEHQKEGSKVINRDWINYHYIYVVPNPQLAFYVNLHRAVIGPSATLTGR